MAIQKITPSELLTEGVRALPTRPSAPSLYGGAPLSAEELKAAFDRLPSLVAYRFNALLDAAGLFEEGGRYETLAELIATGIEEGHSLSQFFRDVTSGSLALYLSVDGERVLADVLSELRQAVSALSRTPVCVVGEGDLLSDVTVTDALVTIHKEGSTEALLSAANAYADAPQGEVDASCGLPVSGAAVAEAIDTVRTACDTEALKGRVSALEDAWEGNVSRFTTVESEGIHHRALSSALPHAKLLRLGGQTRTSRNRLPERILTTCPSETLTVTWDEAEGCLVFNGTLKTSEELTLAHMYVPLPACHHAFGAVYRGGTITGGRPSVRFIDERNRALSVTAPLTGIASASRPFSLNESSLACVALRAPGPITFTDYKCNLFLYPEDGYEVGYDTAQTRHLPTAPPASFCVLGANEWTGEREKQGTGSVLFEAADDRFCEDLFLSFYADCDDLDARVCRVTTTTADGETQAFSCPLRERVSTRLYSPIPFVSFSIAAVPSAGNTETPTLRVSDFQLERIEIAEETGAPYGEPMSYTLSLPSGFSRFADRFYGIRGVACNYLDFERGAFIKQVERITLDGTLTFLADEETPHRFYAEVSLPLGIADAAYLPSAIFRVHKEGEAYDKCLWFSEGRVYLQNESFADGDAVNAYFAAHPIDVLYTHKTELTLFDAEESDFFDAPTVTVSPGAHLYCKAGDGTLTPCYLQILYESDVKREVSV